MEDARTFNYLLAGRNECFVMYVLDRKLVYVLIGPSPEELKKVRNTVRALRNIRNDGFEMTYRGHKAAFIRVPPPELDDTCWKIKE